MKTRVPLNSSFKPKNWHHVFLNPDSRSSARRVAARRAAIKRASISEVSYCFSQEISALAKALKHANVHLALVDGSRHNSGYLLTLAYNGKPIAVGGLKVEFLPSGIAQSRIDFIQGKGTKHQMDAFRGENGIHWNVALARLVMGASYRAGLGRCLLKRIEQDKDFKEPQVPGILQLEAHGINPGKAKDAELARIRLNLSSLYGLTKKALKMKRIPDSELYWGRIFT